MQNTETIDRSGKFSMKASACIETPLMPAFQLDANGPPTIGPLDSWCSAPFD
jgi:hypothetical protein